MSASDGIRQWLKQAGRPNSGFLFFLANSGDVIAEIDLDSSLEKNKLNFIILKTGTHRSSTDLDNSRNMFGVTSGDTNAYPRAREFVLKIHNSR